MQVLGAKRKHLSGYSTATQGLHEGFVFGSEIIQVMGSSMGLNCNSPHCEVDTESVLHLLLDMLVWHAGNPTCFPEESQQACGRQVHPAGAH